jgi:hypothetical protein
MILKILAAIALIWLVCLVIGASFHILGSINWVAVLLTVIGVVYGFLNKDK